MRWQSDTGWLPIAPSTGIGATRLVVIGGGSIRDSGGSNSIRRGINAVDCGLGVGNGKCQPTECEVECKKKHYGECSYGEPMR